MEQTQKNIFSIISKFNQKLSAHGVKLSAEEVADQAEAMKFMAEAALEDGTIVYTPAESWAEGVEIFVKDADGNMVAVPDGDIKTADGSVISVAGGRVVTIAPAEVEAEEPVEEEQAVETFTKADVESMISDALNSFKAELSAKDEEISKLSEQLNAEKQARAELSKQAAAVSVKQTAVKAPKLMNQIDSVQGRINALINR